jgi:TRAP-type C4-dicarboxylate transport system permease large subunit
MIIICLVRRTLSWKNFWKAMLDTGRLTAMVFILLLIYYNPLVT